MAKREQNSSERERSPRKTKSRKSSGDNAKLLRNVVTSVAATETLVDLVERLGLVDMVVGKVRSRIEETDIDELLDEGTAYLRRNPEVLVATLGAATVATGLVVWLNSRRAWDGHERRAASSDERIRKAS